MSRTSEEIKRQIDGLNAQKNWLPEYSKLGNANWAAIAVQIEVLQDETSSEDLDEDDDEDLYEAAVQAEDWRDGMTDEDLFETRE